MKRTARIIGIVAISGVVGGFGAAAPVEAADMDDVPLTLTGCVVAGEKKDSYLLTNVTIDGTTAAPINAFYRFNTTNGLKKHVGRRVEVKGKADLDDVDAGKLRVKAEDGKLTTEITSERRTVKVNEAWFGSVGSMNLTADVPTYKFEVENVKRMEGNCSSASAAP